MITEASIILHIGERLEQLAVRLSKVAESEYLNPRMPLGDVKKNFKSVVNRLKPVGTTPSTSVSSISIGTALSAETDSLPPLPSPTSHSSILSSSLSPCIKIIPSYPLPTNISFPWTGDKEIVLHEEAFMSVSSEEQIAAHVALADVQYYLGCHEIDIDMNLANWQVWPES